MKEVGGTPWCKNSNNLLRLVLISGVSITVFGLLLIVLFAIIKGWTSTLIHESIVPSFVSGTMLIVLGIILAVQYKKSNVILSVVSMILIFLCLFSCLNGLIHTAMVAIPIFRHLSFCIFRPISSECECYSTKLNGTYLINNDGKDYSSYIFHNTFSCDQIENSILDVLYTQCVIYFLALLLCITAFCLGILYVCTTRREHKIPVQLSESRRRISQDDESETEQPAIILPHNMFYRNMVIPDSSSSFTLGVCQYDQFLGQPSYVGNTATTATAAPTTANLPGSGGSGPTNNHTAGVGEGGGGPNNSAAAPPPTAGSIGAAAGRPPGASATYRSGSRPPRALPGVERQTERRQRRPGRQRRPVSRHFSLEVGGRDPSQWRQRYRRLSDRRPRQGPARQRGFVQGQAGSGLVPVYTLPGSADMFVSVKDLHSLSPPLLDSLAANFHPSRPPPYQPPGSGELSPPARDQPPPYTPSRETDSSALNQNCETVI